MNKYVFLEIDFLPIETIPSIIPTIGIKKDIKDREIELYKNFQRELASMPSINCKIKNAYATNVMPRSRRNYKELARM